MTFRKRHFVIRVVSCYAPTFRSSHVDKDAFFAELQGVLRDVGRHDISMRLQRSRGYAMR